MVCLVLIVRKNVGIVQKGSPVTSLMAPVLMAVTVPIGLHYVTEVSTVYIL